MEAVSINQFRPEISAVVRRLPEQQQPAWHSALQQRPYLVAARRKQ
jgi:hypothetical protein